MSCLAGQGVRDKLVDARSWEGFGMLRGGFLAVVGDVDGCR